MQWSVVVLRPLSPHKPPCQVSSGHEWVNGSVLHPRLTLNGHSTAIRPASLVRPACDHTSEGVGQAASGGRGGVLSGCPGVRWRPVNAGKSQSEVLHWGVSVASIVGCLPLKDWISMGSDSSFPGAAFPRRSPWRGHQAA